MQAGQNPAGLAAEIRKLTTEAFELLEQGLRDYAAEPPAPRASPVTRLAGSRIRFQLVSLALCDANPGVESYRCHTGRVVRVLPGSSVEYDRA